MEKVGAQGIIRWVAAVMVELLRFFSTTKLLRCVMRAEEGSGTVLNITTS